MKFNNSSDEVGGVEAGTFGTLLLEVYSSTERQTAYYHNQLMKQGTITAWLAPSAGEVYVELF